jgi:H+/Cl- antiporter ClcA
MPFRWNPKEHLDLARYVLKWLLISIPVGIAIGSAVALFLWSLDAVTRLRWGHPWLLFLLPVAGIGIALIYHLVGRSVEAGNNLLMDQIHAPGGGVPARMAPIILVATVVTHLFGGSAGREGTAVQMGGSIAGTIAKWLRLGRADLRTLLMAGIAGGFGAVFGTPLTGAVFAIEVLAIGRLSYDAIIPCLMTSIIGDYTCSCWGILHTQYRVTSVAIASGLSHASMQFSWMMGGKVAVAAVAFGLASVLFAELTHGLHWLFKKLIPLDLLRPAVGGVMVVALAFTVGHDYLGLGVTAPGHLHHVTIVSAFSPGGAQWWSWWWKILFTAVTLSSGFKGGEVTPLFFVGATLGNTMGRLLHAPVDVFAALGFVAVFAGATNTPLACTIMGIELFAQASPELLHSGFVVYLAIACFLAYLFSGHSGIYLSQRIGTPKLHSPHLAADASLRALRDLH